MDCISVADQLPVNGCIAHLFLESEHLGIGCKRIVSTMQDENLPHDIFGVFRSRGVEGGMKRNHAG
jgi:hypothetical protein